MYMDIYIWIQINAVHMDIAKGNKTVGLLATHRVKLSQREKKIFPQELAGLTERALKRFERRKG